MEENLRRLRENDTTLTKLNISRNNLGPEGARHLADALRVNKTLTNIRRIMINCFIVYII